MTSVNQAAREARRAAARYLRADYRAQTERNRLAGLLLDHGDDETVRDAAAESGLSPHDLTAAVDALRARRALLPDVGNPDAPAPQPADTDR